LEIIKIEVDHDFRGKGARIHFSEKTIKIKRIQTKMFVVKKWNFTGSVM